MKSEQAVLPNPCLEEEEKEEEEEVVVVVKRERLWPISWCPTFHLKVLKMMRNLSWDS
jgi:hypothetical protein